MSDRDIKNLLPEETLDLSTGERLVIHPVPFGKIPEFFGDVGALVRKFLTGGNPALLANAEELLTTAFEETVRIAGRIIKKKRAWFNTIDIADGIAIVNVVLRQNIDNDRAKKNLAELAGRVKALLPSQTPFSLSSAQDIASKILSGDTAPDKSGPSAKAS